MEEEVEEEVEKDEDEDSSFNFRRLDMVVGRTNRVGVFSRRSVVQRGGAPVKDALKLAIKVRKFLNRAARIRSVLLRL